jgi:hypothetical protein
MWGAQVSDPQVDDDEWVAIRIPPTSPWFEPPDRVSSANFKVDHRRQESGLSVYRLKIVTATDILSRTGVIQGSFLVVASVKAIRSLCNAIGNPLWLDVISDDDAGRNPRHAEIRVKWWTEQEKMPSSAAKALQRLFVRYEESVHRPNPL